MRTRVGVTAPLLALLAFSPGFGETPAFAQPMMMDPSRMSGIPRPDPAVPNATVTVRLIRGELSNRIVDATVELLSQAEPDKPISAKTDAEGRATFSSLAPGNYQARATVDGNTLNSQPIPVGAPPEPGVRVMLVFPKSGAAPQPQPQAPGKPEAQPQPRVDAQSIAEQQQELGKPDGKARIDLKAPAGGLIVKAVDPAGQPVAGLRVTLLHASRATEKVEALPAQNTAADGSVSYAALQTGGEIGYMASVQKDGSEQRTQPFQLNAEHGSIVALTIQSISRDLNQLRIANGSHAIFEPQDDNVQVMENLILTNPLQQAIDPGPSGLRIPLAEGAMSPQVLPGGPQALSIDATQEGEPVALWKGPIPAGQTMLSVAFILKQRGSVTFRQQSKLKIEGLRVGIAKLPEIHVEGITDIEERKLNGHDFIVASAIVPSAGGPIELTIEGLPRDFYLLRILAALFALAIGLAFTYLAVYGPEKPDDEGNQKQRQKLMAKREQLLDELLRAEAAEGSGGKGKKRDATQVRGELEEIYRKLDESDGP